MSMPLFLFAASGGRQKKKNRILVLAPIGFGDRKPPKCIPGLTGACIVPVPVWVIFDTFYATNGIRPMPTHDEANH